MTKVTVSGPDLDRPADSAGIGLSIAVTYASRLSRLGGAGSYYVRGAETGGVVGRADADGGGGVRVFGQGTLEAYAVRQLPPPDLLDRASERELADSRSDGRPGSPRRPSKEDDEMAEQKMRSRGARAKKQEQREEEPSAPAGKDVGTSATPAAKAATKEKGEKGTDLLAALMQSVENAIAGVEPKTNPSKTSTRLVKDGKTFAVVFPPRSTGLAVKIPRPLLDVEPELPRGHGFHRVGWGLTRTITKASEVPSVVKSFAVAAAKAVPAKPEEAKS